MCRCVPKPIWHDLCIAGRSPLVRSAHPSGARLRGRYQSPSVVIVKKMTQRERMPTVFECLARRSAPRRNFVGRRANSAPLSAGPSPPRAGDGDAQFRRQSRRRRESRHFRVDGEVRGSADCGGAAPTPSTQQAQPSCVIAFRAHSPTPECNAPVVSKGTQETQIRLPIRYRMNT